MVSTLQEVGYFFERRRPAIRARVDQANGNKPEGKYGGNSEQV